MTLIKSISGIRGTIGGTQGDNLTPLDIVKFSAAYCELLKSETGERHPHIILGRDGRISGPMISGLVSQTLVACGAQVTDLGFSTTPSVEMAVPHYKAQGGIILTASHNPRQWNALKLLNSKGEFISGALGEKLLQIAESGSVSYADIDSIGSVRTVDGGFIQEHIDAILALPYVDADAISSANLKVVIDCVNSTGGIAVPMLLERLGVQHMVKLYCEPTGEFPHNPEPLPENLTEISSVTAAEKAHLGIVVDPDVDRLALVCEDGSMFGEEYTLVAVADYILSLKTGNTVSNLSSSRALRDVTEARGGNYSASAVGEVNVVEMMKQVNAVIGGEGNGGIIVPDLHYGRDALAGIAIFLTHYVKSGKTLSALRASYPNYHISKNKIELSPALDVDKILRKMEEKYAGQPVNTIDGVKIEFGKEWVHLRKSNTEPIIRIYSESHTLEAADILAVKVMDDIKKISAE